MLPNYFIKTFIMITTIHYTSQHSHIIITRVEWLHYEDITDNTNSNNSSHHYCHPKYITLPCE